MQNIETSTLNRRSTSRRIRGLTHAPSRHATAGSDRLAAIAADVGCHILVLDDLGVVYRSPRLPQTLVEHLPPTLHADAAGPRRVQVGGGGHTVRAAVIRVELLERVGVKLVFIEDKSELDMAEIDRAAMAVTVEMLRDRAAAELKDRLADGLCELLAGRSTTPDDMIESRAEAVGIALTGPHSVVGVAVGDSASHALRHWIRRLADGGEAPAVAVFERDGAALALLEAASREAGRRFADTLACELSRAGTAARPRIAYAGPHEGVAGARQATTECLQALRVLGLTGHGAEPAAYDELGIWTILGSADAGCLARFRDSTLAPLFEHDRRPASQLVPTLRALVRASFEWRRAAAELGVHPNTVRYRMSVITKLTGLDLATYQDQAKADIALRAADMLTSS